MRNGFLTQIACLQLFLTCFCFHIICNFVTMKFARKKIIECLRWELSKIQSACLVFENTAPAREIPEWKEVWTEFSKMESKDLHTKLGVWRHSCGWLFLNCELGQPAKNWSLLALLCLWGNAVISVMPWCIHYLEKCKCSCLPKHGGNQRSIGSFLALSNL